MNVRGELERNAVGQFDDSLADVRFDFVRSAPHPAAFMSALRTEMSMRAVMPETVPHTEAEPFMAMARFETGDGGNPHFHGFTVGAGGPQLGRVNADMDKSVLAGDLAPASGDDDGTDPAAEGASDEAAPCDERASSGALGSDCGEPEEKGSSPDVDPYESEPECDAHGGVASPAGLAAAASTRGAGGGDSVAAGSVVLGKRPRAKKKAKRELRAQASAASSPDVLYEQNGHNQQQSEMERVFARYFGELVSEWNPCFDEEGNARFVWDEDVGAHDVEVQRCDPCRVNAACPERTRLRHVLDDVFKDDGEKLDLEPVRRLVAALV